jgi:hypothetical protein
LIDYSLRFRKTGIVFISLLGVQQKKQIMQTPSATDPKYDRKKGSDYDKRPGITPEREGGDDALESSSPADYNSDEKVIVNEQRANKTVNTPSQTAAHTSEAEGTDEDVIQ